MKKKLVVIFALLFLISLGNYFGIVSNGTIRAVEFVSILAIGALLGVLLTLIFSLRKEKQINK
ncbi:MAG: hypothetical protein HZB41_06630 [Ignavibacteriae bacterium]|nr:hypothetical protein [Ignavibacteriota bacterium]